MWVHSQSNEIPVYYNLWPTQQLFNHLATKQPPVVCSWGQDMMDHGYTNASSNVHTTKCTYGRSWFCCSLYARTDVITGSCNSQNKVINNPHFCMFCISLQWEGDSGKERPGYKCSKSSTYIARLRGYGDLSPQTVDLPSQTVDLTFIYTCIWLQCSERSAVRWLLYCQQHTHGWLCGSNIIEHAIVQWFTWIGSDQGTPWHITSNLYNHVVTIPVL